MARRRAGREGPPLLVYLLRSPGQDLDPSVVALGRLSPSGPEPLWRLLIGKRWPPPRETTLAILPFEAILHALERGVSDSLRQPPFIASGTSSQLTAAFAAGALDFLRVPWEAEELGERVTRALQNVGVSRGLRLGTFSAAENRVLRGLILAGEEGAPREALFYLAYGDRSSGSGRRLDMFVSRLRQKLRDLPGAPEIRTVRGWGFQLEPNSSRLPVDNLWAKSSKSGSATHRLSDSYPFDEK